jgi:hypothetical protein
MLRLKVVIKIDIGRIFEVLLAKLFHGPRFAGLPHSVENQGFPVAVVLSFEQVFKDFSSHETILTGNCLRVKEKGAKLTPFSQEKSENTTPFYQENSADATPFSREKSATITPFSREKSVIATPYSREKEMRYTPFSQENSANAAPFSCF